MFNHTACPICNHTQFVKFLDCKDYTVSQETFSIVSCTSCQFKFTNPIPEHSALGNYYKSESYISHSDTRKGLIAQLYHIVRSVTLRRKVSILSRYVSRGTLLDYGCGTGMFLRTCKAAGWDVVGVEPDLGAATLARKSGAKVYGDLSVEELVHPQREFDAITLWHVLEHVTDLKGTLSFFRDHLKKDGVLVIAVPNYTSYDARFYSRDWAAYDVPRHLYHFSPDSIQQLLSAFGFQLKEMLPMKFDSFYVSMLSEKYKNGSVRYAAAFWRGLMSNFKARHAGEYSSVIYIFKKK